MRSTKGFTLLEILISLLVLSIGLLGLVGLQTRGLQFNQNSLYQSQATIYVTDMVDRVRANKTVIPNYLTDFNETAANNKDCSEAASSTPDCTPKEMAEFDLYEWKQILISQLPSGKGRVVQETIGAVDLLVVSVQYDSSRGEDSPKEFSMRVEL